MKYKLFFIFLSCFVSNYAFRNGSFGIPRHRTISEDTPFPEPECIAYDGRLGRCTLLVKCSNHIAKIAKLSRSPCKITEYQQGVCCPRKQEPSMDPSLMLDEEPGVPMKPMSFPEISSNSVDEACYKSMTMQFNEDKLKRKLADNHIMAPPESPTFWHARLFETSDEIFKLSKDANTILHATMAMKNNFHLDKNEVENGLSHFSAKESIISDMCPTDPFCSIHSDIYRTIDGSCNNMRHTDWGKAGMSFKRIIPPDYADDISVPRRAVSGRELPSARLVSSKIAPAQHSSYDSLDSLIWQWGQFLDHDITHTAVNKGHNMSVDISCCTTNGWHRPEDERDPDCFPIDIPENDEFYGKFGQSCMDFVRSMTGFRPFCTFGPKEQMNQITSYIDASQIYGSSVLEMERLRSFKDGKLKVQKKRNRELLPPNDDDVRCNRGPHKCFLAGDSRVNEQPNLALMHTLFMRQHNKIVEGLAEVNPHWNDQHLFQEGRRIVGAQMQHITYNEYLPIVLGNDFMESVGLSPLKDGVFEGYRDDVDATITNAFATAAFRYGHSLITDDLMGFDKFGTLKNNLVLSENQFVPFSLYDPQMLDNLIRGLSLQHSQKFDRFFSKQITQKLFAQNKSFGMDLVALNIQRGRDHGLPGYTKWRKACNLSPVTSWRDLKSIFEPEVIASMQEVYASVDDIDLFVGATAEEIVPNTLVGETFFCILGKQFIKLKIGDRLYYENGNSRHPTRTQFTAGQLAQIRNTTFSRILCDNSDNIELMQPMSFSIAVLANKRAACSSDRLIPKLNLRPWAD